MPDLLLNARFLTRPLTGVDRTATELIAALIARDGVPGFGGIRAVRPLRDIADPEDRPADLLAVTAPTPSMAGGHFWEQTVLARHRPEDWLLSLCNTGPVSRGRQIVMLHDAQVFREPQSYGPAFRALYRHLQPRLARKAALVLTVSDYARRELERFGVVPPGQARIVPNGADHILRARQDPRILIRHGLRPGRFILAVGGPAPHKNLKMLAEAARLRQDRSMPLVIAGGPSVGAFIDAGLTPCASVRLLGRVSEGELRALYEAATALAFPSLTEGFGLPPAEAMLCGCPVIASTGGAIPEVCGGAALAVGPRDRAGWTRAMERVAADPALRQRLAEAGRRRGARFTWAEAADILAGHLSDLTDTRPAIRAA